MWVSEGHPTKFQTFVNSYVEDVEEQISAVVPRGGAGEGAGVTCRAATPVFVGAGCRR